MNIVFIRTTSAVSGAEIYTKWLCTELKKNGDNPAVLTDNQKFASDLQKADIPVTVFGIHVPEAGTKRSFLTGMLSEILFSAFVITRLASFSGDKPVVVLESMTEKLFLTGLLRTIGYCVFWIEHGPLFRTDRWGFVKRRYAQTSHIVSGILAVSEDTKTDLISGGVAAGSVTVIPIGVPDKDIGLSLGADIPLTVGYMGSLSEAKGFPEFMKIVDVLGDKYPQLQFRVIGDGPLYVVGMSDAKSETLDGKVTFIQNPENYVGEIDQCDIVVFPTHHEEGLSIALMQTLGRGKAVIARDIGGNRELVRDGISGKLVQKTGEVRMFVEAVANLIDSWRLGRTYGNAAYALINQNYRLSIQTKKMHAYFQSVCPKP